MARPLPPPPTPTCPQCHRLYDPRFDCPACRYPTLRDEKLPAGAAWAPVVRGVGPDGADGWPTGWQAEVGYWTDGTFVTVWVCDHTHERATGALSCGDAFLRGRR